MGKVIYFFAVIILAMTAVYAFFIEPSRVCLKNVTIHNKTMASMFKGLKIIQLSDIHIGKSWSAPADRTLEIINSIKPDIIFLTGDYVQWHGGTLAYNQALNFLSYLHAPLGVYAVMGDADYSYSRKSCEFCHIKGSALPAIRHKVRFLQDSGAFIRAGKNEFYIAGINGNSKPEIYKKIIEELPSDVPVILLSHKSLVYHYIDADKNILVLSGDTHGGQMYLPKYLWKIFKRKESPEYMYGLYQSRKKSLYVTSGIGTSELQFRLGMPPEVVLFEFKE